VQLKCTEVVRARGYDIQPLYAIYGQGKVVYTADQIDVLVAHIIPKDAWYVLPVDAVRALQEPSLLSRHRMQARPLGELPRGLASAANPGTCNSNRGCPTLLALFARGWDECTLPEL
jgi:hypothetical protein